MKYEISKKNIKQSVQNLTNILNKNGIIVPRNIALEAIAKVFFMKNWNTLEGVSTDPEKIKYIEKQKLYLIEIDTNCPKEKLLDLLKISFKQGNCLFNMTNFNNHKSLNLIELDLTKNNNNIITALFFFKENIEKTSYIINRMDMARLFSEKENLTELFKGKNK